MTIETDSKTLSVDLAGSVRNSTATCMQFLQQADRLRSRVCEVY